MEVVEEEERGNRKAIMKRNKKKQKKKKKQDPAWVEESEEEGGGGKKERTPTISSPPKSMSYKLNDGGNEEIEILQGSGLLSSKKKGALGKQGKTLWMKKDVERRREKSSAARNDVKHMTQWDWHYEVRSQLIPTDDSPPVVFSFCCCCCCCCCERLHFF